MASFAIATPSRGLVHSRTVAAILANARAASGAGHDNRGWFLTHDLPIPASHERCAAAALDSGADVIWFVEEDNVPPPGALLALLALGTPVAALDYPLGDTLVNCITHRSDGEPWLVGLGCTLIARRVFEALERPWFRTDVAYRLTQSGALAELTRGYDYGGLDVSFSIRAGKAGFDIGEVPPAELICGHAVLQQRGTPGSNDGAHRIDVHDQIQRWH